MASGRFWVESDTLKSEITWTIHVVNNQISLSLQNIEDQELTVHVTLLRFEWIWFKNTNKYEKSPSILYNKRLPLSHAVTHLHPVSYTHLDVYKRQLVNTVPVTFWIVTLKMGSNGGSETSVPIDSIRPRPNNPAMSQNFNRADAGRDGLRYQLHLWKFRIASKNCLIYEVFNLLRNKLLYYK